MVSNDERQKEVLKILTKSNSFTFAIASNSWSDGYLYGSLARPIWEGMLNSAREVAGFVNRVSGEDRVVETQKPLSLKFLNDHELYPISKQAKLAMVEAEFGSNFNLFLHSAKTKQLVVMWSGADKVFASQLDISVLAESRKNTELQFSSLSEAILAMQSVEDFTVIDPTYGARQLDARLDARMLTAELGKIRRKEHLGFDSGSDPVANAEYYINTFVSAQIDRAKAIAAQLLSNVSFFSRESGLPPLRIEQIASLIMKAVGYKSEMEAQTKLENKGDSMAKKQRWIDLSAHGVYLGDQRMADGQSRLFVLDMNNRGDQKRLAEIGFLPVKGSPRYEHGIYYLHGDDQRMRPKALAAAFGLTECPLVDVDPREIDKVFREKIAEKFAANLNAIILRSTPLGQNKAGQAVFGSAVGRFIRLSLDNAVSENSEQGKKLGKTSFLRGATDAELRDCAQGFIWGIRQGGKMAWPDLVRFAKSVFDTAKGEEPSAEQMHRMQEAVEAAGYQHFSDVASKPDEAAFKAAMDFYYGLPAARMRTSESVFLQQYSTPLPMGVVAQRLLIGEDLVKGKSAYDPTAGNGGLLNLLPEGMTKYAVELDKKRYEALVEVGTIKAALADATNFDLKSTFDAQGVDYVIANPPFGAMPEARVFDKLKSVGKLDHYIPLKALESRKDQGRAVIIFGADSSQSDGTLKGGSKSFMNYVCDHYDVHGAVEVDGRLYARHGAGLNVRILVVGDKRPEPIQAQTPEKLDIITTYEDLWNWSTNVIDIYSKPSSLDLKAIKFGVGDDIRFTPDILTSSFASGVVEGKVIQLTKVAYSEGTNFKCDVRSSRRVDGAEVYFEQHFYTKDGLTERLQNTVDLEDMPISASFDNVVAPLFGGTEEATVLVRDTAVVKHVFTDAPINTYVREKSANNSVKLRPLPGKAFSSEDIAALVGWMKENGWSANQEKNFIRAIGPMGATWEDVPEADRPTKADEATQKRLQEQADRKEQQASDLLNLEAVEWINANFDSELLNNFNKAALARYLDGIDEQFNGIAGRAWLEVAMQKVGIAFNATDILDTRDVLLPLKVLYESSKDIELSASSAEQDTEVDSLEWINRYFDSNAMAPQNRLALVNFLNGDGALGSYREMVDRSWLPGLAALGLSSDEVQSKSVDEVLDAVYKSYEKYKQALNASSDNNVGAEKVLQPWEMVKANWDRELALGVGMDAATNEARREYLRFGVTKWASDKLASSQKDNVKLSDEELGEITDRLNAPVTHRDVIDKALSEGKKVPMEVLSDYPDLSMPSERHVNEFQVPYQSASKGGEPSAMVPINMAGSTYAALNRLETRFGPIDDYVAKKLQYDVSELPAYFSAEQIDAIGLGIKAVEEGRGIINADQTGLGKGRFVAAMLRYARLHGKTPVFLTIKPELFTDIFRDISDIGSQHLFKKLFIFNDGEYVRKFGTEKEVLYPVTTPLERSTAITSGAVADDVDMVLATYSQFMRSYQRNPKAKLLTDIVRKNGMLLLDESHVASGASNLSSTVSQAVTNSSSVMYSSATPLKGVSNFGIYSKVLPASVNLSTLGDTLKAGGEALQESISANMARDGVLIRREHDFSKLTFHTRNPSNERRERNVMLANELSSILADLSYLSGDVSKVVSKMNKGFKSDWEAVPEQDRTGYRMQASSMNFGSRLYSINRQFLLGIKIDDAVDAALESLRNGQKPIIAVENTGESLLRQVIAKRAGVAHLELELLEIDEKGVPDAKDKQRREVLISSINDAMRNVTLDDAPQFRELLEIMLDRVGVIKVQGRYGEYTREIPSSKEYIEAAARLREQIRNFPDLALTPIDIIKRGLEASGHPVAEVSGRKTSIKANAIDNKRWDVAFHPKVDAVSNVAGFQNGKYDCIVITRSGSTGISLHATDRFADSDIRQRNFIVLQKAANIAEFLQWMGRANRKDQVIAPVITGLESGLPAELRLTMMHNTKLRKLSANTTSNRDNANIEGENLDLLNDVGDRVALDWLVENPDIAAAFDISLPSDDDLEDMSRFAQDCPYINKLMGRLAMVNVAKQEEILQVLTNRFADRVEELEQRGENPFKVQICDWKAEIVKEENLQSGVIRATSSSFDEPVKMATIRYEQTIYPVRSARLLEMIRDGLESFKREAAEGDIDPSKRLKAYIISARDAYIRSQLPQKLRDSNDPLYTLLDNKDVMAAKNAKEKADFLIANLSYFRPGARVVYDDLFKGERQGVIVGISYPYLLDPDDVFLLSKYRAKVMFAGDDKPHEITLATMKSQGKDLVSGAWMTIEPDTATLPHVRRKLHQVLGPFDEAPEGKQIRTQYVLQGNLFRACELAVQERLGSPILYTDVEGNRQRAVLLKSFVTPEIVKSLPIALNSKDTSDYINEFLKPSHPDHAVRTRYGQFRIFSSGVKDMKKGEGLMLEVLNGGGSFRLSMPGTKSRSGALMTDGAIFDIGENTPNNSLKLKLTGTKAFMEVDVSRKDLPKLLALMEAHHHVGKFYIPVPDADVIETLKSKYQQEMDARAATVSRDERDDSLTP